MLTRAGPEGTRPRSTTMVQVPESLTSSASSRERRQVKHLHARQMVTVVARALGAQARIMPLRGVLLGALGVVAPEERPLQDVDVVVDGIGVAAAVAQLQRFGLRVVEIARDHNTVWLHSARFASLRLAILGAPLPGWPRQISNTYMFERAEENTALFSERVWVPLRTRLAVHLIGHVIHDRVLHAFRHSANDLASLAATCSSSELDAIAADLRHLQLADAGILTVVWAQAVTGANVLEDLASRLEPHPGKRAEHWDTVTALPELDESQRGISLVPRRAPRELTPRMLDQLVSAFAVLSYPVRRVWLYLHALRWH
jgi:hypothetical protein